MNLVTKYINLGVLLLIGFSPQTIADSQSHNIVIGKTVAGGNFISLREPSGVTALNAQTLIIVEDEANRALQQLTVTLNEKTEINLEESVQHSVEGLTQSQNLMPLDDLEGVARVDSQTFFIIGSHENASKGEHVEREQILLLTREGEKIVKMLGRVDLFEQLASNYPDLGRLVSGRKKGSKRALNIEAIAFDRNRQILHIGFRTPLVNDNAIIISLNNAIEYLHGSEPLFSEDLQFVNLDGGGIRAMAYDDSSDTLLIVGRKSKDSALWVLDASMNKAAISYTSEDKELFTDVEGLTPIAGNILFVRDGGGKSKNVRKQWFVLSRTQLGLKNEILK